MLQVKIDGIRELTRAIKTISPELSKELGKRNKEIGARIIAASQPKPDAVGAGAGAIARPSASKNVLKIVAGGSHRRAVPVQQWGARPVPRGGGRPYIWKAAEEFVPRAIEDYLDAVIDIARRAGLEATL
ncbi:MAG: hypothetical protein ACRDH9_05380 [Actinomycetota bacterium]